MKSDAGDATAETAGRATVDLRGGLARVHQRDALAVTVERTADLIAASIARAADLYERRYRLPA